MSELKIRSLRETFEENYKAVQIPARNRKGFRIEYVYIGKWFCWKEEPSVVQKVKTWTAAVLFASVLLYLIAGLCHVPVNWSRAVSLTGLLSLAPLLFLVIGEIQFLVSKDKMTEQTCREIRTKLLIAPAFHGGLLLLCAAAGMYAAIRSAGGRDQVMVCLCYLISGLLSLSIIFMFRRLHPKELS